MTYTIKYPEDKDKYEQFRYPAGEEQVRIREQELNKIAEADEIVVIARISDSSHLFGLSLLTDALNNINFDAKYTLVLPYLPYSRADRRFTEGDCNGLKTFGRFVDSLVYDRVITLDVHNERAAKKYIQNLITISPVSFIENVLDTLPKNTLILLPDEGAKRYKLEDKFPKRVFYGSKKRDSVTGKLLGFDVPNEIEHAENVLIVDDICDGGGTFLGIASQLIYPDHVYLYITHGMFSKGYVELFNHFNKIFVTDSFTPVSDYGDYDRFFVLPVQGLINKETLELSEMWKLAKK